MLKVAFVKAHLMRAKRTFVVAMAALLFCVTPLGMRYMAIEIRGVTVMVVPTSLNVFFPKTVKVAAQGPL